jgi:SAM-dependent methyltransferase
MSELKTLKLIEPGLEENALLCNYVIKRFSNEGTLNILEAGCGQEWPLDLKGLRYVLTGVDLDGESLRLRKEQKGDLHKIILGDLRTINLKENNYDIIYNSFVLEHIEGAIIVLDNFLKWLRPSGIIVLKIPDRDSVFGYVARLTPFWFHVFYKRYVEQKPNAGKSGYDPFPTIYDKVVSRKGIHRYCEKHSLAIMLEFGTNWYLKSFGKCSVFVRIFTKFIELVSLGTLKSDHDNLIFVLEKSQCHLPEKKPSQPSNDQSGGL